MQTAPHVLHLLLPHYQHRSLEPQLIPVHVFVIRPQLVIQDGGLVDVSTSALLGHSYKVYSVSSIIVHSIPDKVIAI